MAKDAGWAKIELQSDCKNVVNMMKERRTGVQTVTTIVEGINQLADWFSVCNFNFVSRKRNCLSHYVAKFASTLVKNVMGKLSFPLWLKQMAQDDLIGSCPHL